MEAPCLSFEQYQQAAMRTRSEDLGFSDCLCNAALGIVGEGGEVAGLVKKFLHQGHPLNRTKLQEEAGDVLWYLAELADTLGTTLDKIAQANLDKLAKRYPEGFSPEDSVNRST